MSAVWRPLVSSIAAAGALYSANHVIDLSLVVGVRLVLDFALYVIFYVLIWISLPHGRRSVRDLIGIARELRPNRAPAADEPSDPLL